MTTRVPHCTVIQPKPRKALLLQADTELCLQPIGVMMMPDVQYLCRKVAAELELLEERRHEDS